MKLCLISPPTVIDFNERLVTEFEATQLILEHAPMGILSLAAVLEQQGIESEIVDLNRLFYTYISGDFRRNGVDFCSYAINQFDATRADVFGFSTICSSYPLTLRLARGIREIHGQASIVLGGPQASVVDVATLETFPFVDLIVRGEAEETLPRVLHELSRRQPSFANLAGVTYRHGESVLRNPNAPVIEDLDQLPMPAFHLYSYTNSCNFVPVEAGRGCPFACTFCSTNDFFRRRFRLKSAHVLVEQMKTIKRTYNITSFDLIHDMFTVDRKKVVGFCEAVGESGEDLYWGCSARTDCIDDELIDLMAANGCTGIFFGIDSGSDRMQTMMHKRLNLADAAFIIRRANRRGINHTVSLITGFPEETKEDLRCTINFIGESLRHQNAQIQLHLLAPLAETPITTQYEGELIFDDIFSDISFHGWEQDPVERAMIKKHRRLFPNFYAVPTRWLDRQYLREIREFILHGIAKARWLMVLLHRESGDLMSVFDQWIQWSSRERKIAGTVDTSRGYYSGARFPRDLTRFVESDYLQSARYPHVIKTIVDLVNAIQDFEGKSYRAKLLRVSLENLDSRPEIANDARCLVVSADYMRLMRALKRRERLDSIPIQQVPLGLLKEQNEIKVVQLTDTSYELMQLCDGARTIKQIAGQFSAVRTLGVSPLKASIYGLASLARLGLISIAPSNN
jgi:radical SAM superfamily enzyme YgiQ (UPF0313 family)